MQLLSAMWPLFIHVYSYICLRTHLQLFRYVKTSLCWHLACFLHNFLAQKKKMQELFTAGGRIEINNLQMHTYIKYIPTDHQPLGAINFINAFSVLLSNFCFSCFYCSTFYTFLTTLSPSAVDQLFPLYCWCIDIYW